MNNIYDKFKGWFVCEFVNKINNASYYGERFSNYEDAKKYLKEKKASRIWYYGNCVYGEK